MTLREDVPPRGYVGGGTLYTGASGRGTSTVSYSAIDEESGIATVTALLGGTVVGFQDFSAQCPYADFAACPGGRTTSIAVDTTGLGEGVYPLELRVTDAAGNVGILSGGPVRVASTGPVANGSGATADALISASFAGRRGTRARVSYKGRLTVRGRLRSRSGAPIGGARVELLERPALRGAKAVRRVAITRADGSFRHRVGPRVASRTISVGYRPDLSADKIAVSKRLRLDVKSTASLRVKLSGVRVTYRVRVWARPVPRRGKRVLIQGRASGGAWTTFATRRTDRKGRLTGRYRLRVRRPGVRLQFRARIPKESGYPFTAATTRTVVRRVR